MFAHAPSLLWAYTLPFYMSHTLSWGVPVLDYSALATVTEISQDRKLKSQWFLSLPNRFPSLPNGFLLPLSRVFRCSCEDRARVMGSSVLGQMVPAGWCRRELRNLLLPSCYCQMSAKSAELEQDDQTCFWVKCPQAGFCWSLTMCKAVPVGWRSAWSRLQAGSTV